MILLNIASLIVLDYVNYGGKVLGEVEKTALYLFKVQKKMKY